MSYALQMTMQQPLGGFAPRPKLKLSEIERLLRKTRAVVPCPARQTLINWCEEGVFETAPRSTERDQWLVYEDSFLNWLRKLDGIDA